MVAVNAVAAIRVFAHSVCFDFGPSEVKRMPFELVETNAYWSDAGPLMSEKEFARAVGLAPVTVRMKRTRGEIPHYRFGRAIRYSREMVEDYLALAYHSATKKSKAGSRRA